MTKNKHLFVILCFLVLLVLTAFLFRLLGNHKKSDFLPDEYQYCQVGKSTLRLVDGKVDSSDIYVNYDGSGLRLIYRDSKLTGKYVPTETTASITGKMLIDFVDALSSGFHTVSGYEASNISIISNPNFIKALGNDVEIIWYSISDKIFEQGVYDGSACLSAASVMAQDYSRVVTILFKE